MFKPMECPRCKSVISIIKEPPYYFPYPIDPIKQNDYGCIYCLSQGFDCGSKVKFIVRMKFGLWARRELRKMKKEGEKK